MREWVLGRSNVAQTALLSAVTLVAVALLGLVLAYWTWQWFAPRPEPRAPAAAARAGSAASARALFGNFQRRQEAVAQTGIAIRLLGVASAVTGRRSHAVLQLEGKQVVVVEEGEDVTPGVKLADVRADHVILERGGVREKLAWPQRKPTASPAAPAGGPASAAAATSAASAAASAAAQEESGPAGRSAARKAR